MKALNSVLSLLVFVALQTSDRLWAAEYDPCSVDNFRKTLLSGQEAGMLDQYINNCHKKNPKRSRDYMMAHLQVDKEKNPEGVQVRNAVMKDCDRMAPAATADFDALRDATGLRGVKLMGEAYDGVAYDIKNIMPGNGVIEVVVPVKVRNTQTGEYEYINKMARQNFDYEELYSPDGEKKARSVKVNAHLFFDEECKPRYDKIDELTVKFGRNNTKPVAVRAVTGKNCLTTCPYSDTSKDICYLQLESLPPTSKVTPTPALRLSQEQIELMAKYRMPVTLAGHAPSAKGSLDGFPLSERRFLQDTFLFFKDYAYEHGVVMHAADAEVGSSGAGLMVTSQNLKILFPEAFRNLPAGSYKIATNLGELGEGNIATYTD